MIGSDIIITKNKKNIDTNFLDITIPQSAETMQLPDPTLLQFYKNFENRILWIDEEISTMTLEYAKMIMQWNFEDKLNNVPVDERKPIKILFFSPGGDLDVNNCLIDTIALSKTKIVGINVGLAASSGCFIYLSCHEKLMFPTAQFLLHKGSAQFTGDYANVVSAIMNYQDQIDKLGEFVLSHTKIPEDLFNENFSTDWYLTADDAIKFGVADRVVESLDEVL